MKNLSADVAVFSHYNISMCKLVSHLSEQVNDKGHAVVSSSVCVCDKLSKRSDNIILFNSTSQLLCQSTLNMWLSSALMLVDWLHWSLSTLSTTSLNHCWHSHDVRSSSTTRSCLCVCVSVCLSWCVCVCLCVSLCVCLVAGDSDSVHHSTYTDSAHSIPANQTYATHSLLPLLCLTLSVIHCSHMFYVHGFDTLVPSTCTGISQGTGHC